MINMNEQMRVTSIYIRELATRLDDHDTSDYLKTLDLIMTVCSTTERLLTAFGYIRDENV